MYKFIDANIIQRLTDGAFIPADPANRDYAEYLAWLDAGNVPEQPPAPTLDELRQALTDAATAHRWDVETGGLILPSGVAVATGTADQNRITTVIANARLAGVQTVDFKAASGWVTLTLAEIEAIASAIALHVQACFTAERAHHEAIALLDTGAAIAAYDISAGWPA